MHVRERLGADQRPVAAEHEHVAFCAVERVACALDGVPRAELLVLHRVLHSVVRGQRFAHQLLLVPNDNDDSIAPGLEARVDHRADHRAVADRVADLRQVRLHPRALAGRENDR
jgi:hypothetical protein